MDFLKREIRTLAAYKYNIFSPYFEHTFAYASTPVAAFPGGTLTPDQARELVAYAAQYHITIIPEQESFGHLHNVLKFEQYSPLGETPHGSVLAPGDANTLPVIGGWFAELAKVFPGPWAHIGADETFDLGLGRTHDAVKTRGLGAVYLDYLTQIHKTLEPNHKQLLFWGDIAENSPDLVKTLPKDMIAVPWEYDAKPDFTSIIEPFTKAGLETWVAPGVNNWSRPWATSAPLCATARSSAPRACSTPCGTTMARASSTKTGSACCSAQRPPGSRARAPKQRLSPRTGRRSIATRPAKSARRSRRSWPRTPC
jgi:hypothetical protein